MPIKGEGIDVASPIKGEGIDVASPIKGGNNCSIHRHVSTVVKVKPL